MRTCAVCGAGIDQEHGRALTCPGECRAKRRRENQARRRVERADHDREYRAAYYQKNIEKIRKLAKEYRKKNPEKSSSRERREKFKESHPNYFADWRKQNPDYMKNWREKNRDKKRLENSKRRMLLSNAGTYLVTDKDLRRLLTRQSYLCVGCLVNLNDVGVKKELDHIIPVSKSGRHSIGNLQWLCSNCNIEKHGHLPIEWKRRHNKARTTPSEINIRQEA